MARRNDHNELTWSATRYDPRDIDLILLTENNRFGVHKDVIQNNCDYFKAMFASQMVESTKDVINLKMVKSSPFQILLESFYTGHLQPTESNIFSLAETAQMLQVSPTLLSKCSNYLLNMISFDSVYEIMHRSNCSSLYLVDVFNAAKRFALAHFSDLMDCTSFHKLSSHELSAYLSDKYLVVDQEIQIVRALHLWLQHNDNLSIQTVREIIVTCFNLRKSPESVNKVCKAIMNSDVEKLCDLSEILIERPKFVDVFMFWSLMDSTESSVLIDVTQVSTSTWEGFKFGSMDSVEASPGSDMGSAICTVGSVVYLSGGGNKFGSVNWIRDIWKFDFSHPTRQWVTVGKLAETRRHHAMVYFENCLYIFGGFGKFRVKNTKMECFDLSTGLWEDLAPMPVHEVSPAATVHKTGIYYLGGEQAVYKFCTTSRSWTSYQYESPLLPGVSPVALHVDPRRSNSFLGLFSGDGKFCLLSVHLDSTVVRVEEECGSLDLDSHLTFIGSVISDASLLLFFGCPRSAAAAHSTGTSESLIVRSLCLHTGLLNDSQVVKAITR
ncbi:hypothetical protein Btru_059312 [Bulinus truncatus]|nr:hypothetical protein Btru_059312 [Bulinus truncatus]